MRDKVRREHARFPNLRYFHECRFLSRPLTSVSARSGGQEKSKVQHRATVAIYAHGLRGTYRTGRLCGSLGPRVGQSVYIAARPIIGNKVLNVVVLTHFVKISARLNALSTFNTEMPNC